MKPIECKGQKNNLKKIIKKKHAPPKKKKKKKKLYIYILVYLDFFIVLQCIVSSKRQTS